MLEALAPASGSLGYRGYIASRRIDGERIPQHIQNLVIRDYARVNNLPFKLSATEFRPEECFLVLDGVINELETLDGVILYSLFMLPRDRERRFELYRRFLDTGTRLYAAVEDCHIATEKDVERMELIFRLSETLSSCIRQV